MSLQSKEITYEQFIAGALQKFDVIDNVDMSILVQDIKNKLGVNLVGSWTCPILGFELSRVIKHNLNNGSVGWIEEFKKIKEFEITEGYSVSQEDIKKSLRERLQAIAGEEVICYFASLDMKSHQKQKRNEIQKYQEQLTQHANVLLISELQEDYGDLVKMGFTRINWFRSAVGTSEYFEQDPNALKGHNIIILSRECALNLKPETIELINKGVKVNNISLIQIDREAFEYLHEINVWIYDSIVGKYKQLYVEDINALYKAIAECALTNQLIDGPIRVSYFKSISNMPSTNKIGNYSSGFVYLTNELYTGCQMIESYLNRISNGDFVPSLSNQYRIRKMGSNITISGIYDGSRTSFTVYVRNNKYKVFSRVNELMVRLFIEEISKELKKIRNKERKERRKRKTMLQEKD